MCCYTYYDKYTCVLSKEEKGTSEGKRSLSKRQRLMALISNFKGKQLFAATKANV